MLFVSKCFQTVDVLEIVVGSLAYWCDVFMHINIFVNNNNAIIFPDLFGIMEDGLNCNVNVLRDEI